MRVLGCIAAMAVVCSLSPAAEKQLKPGETELYNAVLKELNGMNFPNAIADLETWQQKIPDSDFRDERAAFYVQAYGGANQPAKALDSATSLIAGDLAATFPGAAGQAVTIRLLYNAAWAIAHVANPSAAQLATGEKAARQLAAYDRPLPDVSQEKWTEARADMRAKADAALLYIAMLPGAQAMAKQAPDCAGAEAAYTRAVREYPENAAVSYELGRALNCEAKTSPEKRSSAVYEFLRAATLDATLGDPRNDPKKIRQFAESAYIRLHGSDEGLEQLRAQVKQSPLPTANFNIRTATEIAEEKRIEFEQKNPQLALWMKVKGALSGEDGAQYFDAQLKNAAVPELTGVVVDATPTCRPKELAIAIPLPGVRAPFPAEIRLKLDKPLTGKPDFNAEVHFEGVPSAFAREPFLLTMDADGAKIRGLKVTPCAPAVRRK